MRGFLWSSVSNFVLDIFPSPGRFMPSILWSIEGLSGQVKGVKLPATVQLQDPDAYHPPPPPPPN